jgi:hypothetical protein
LKIIERGKLPSVLHSRLLGGLGPRGWCGLLGAARGWHGGRWRAVNGGGNRVNRVEDMGAGLAVRLAQLGHEQGRWAAKQVGWPEKFGRHRGKGKKMERWRAGRLGNMDQEGFGKF